MTTTLITGASSGIGEALAHCAAKDQCDLIIVARREDRLRALAETLEQQHGVNVSCIAMDLSQTGSAASLMKKIDASQVDYLINNAGFGEQGEFISIAAKRNSQMMQLNMNTLVELSQALLPSMLARGSGRIMNVASVAAFQPCPNMALYAATKAFVLFFSEGLAEEVRKQGVTVTALCPGITETEFQQQANIDLSAASFIKFPDAETVAQYGYKAMLKGQTVAVEGRVNQVTTQAARVMPRAVLRKALGIAVKRR